MKNSTTIFVAGGTAGHVFSANGMAYYSKTKNIIITDSRGEKFIDKSLFDEIHILPIKNRIIKNFFSFLKSFVESWRIIKKYESPVVVGFGAYISVPPCLTAWVLRKQMYIYQADQVIGKANQLLVKFAKKMFTSSFKIKHKKAECVGLIPRHDILAYPLKFDDELRILILGGSLSSTFWKIAIPSTLHKLPKEILSKICIHQQVGNYMAYFTKAYADIPLKQVKLDKFIDTSVALKWSNLVIARAGMGTISDLTASVRPALLVPWANAKDNHQMHNAHWWASSNGGWYRSETEFTPEYLKDFIIKLFESNELQKKSKALSKWMPTHGGLIAAEYIETHR